MLQLNPFRALPVHDSNVLSVPPLPMRDPPQQQVGVFHARISLQARGQAVVEWAFSNEGRIQGPGFPKGICFSAWEYFSEGGSGVFKERPGRIRRDFMNADTCLESGRVFF